MKTEDNEDPNIKSTVEEISEGNKHLKTETNAIANENSDKDIPNIHSEPRNCEDQAPIQSELEKLLCQLKHQNTIIKEELMLLSKAKEDVKQIVEIKTSNTADEHKEEGKSGVKKNDIEITDALHSQLNIVVDNPPQIDDNTQDLVTIPTKNLPDTHPQAQSPQSRVLVDDTKLNLPIKNSDEIQQDKSDNDRDNKKTESFYSLNEVEVELVPCEEKKMGSYSKMQSAHSHIISVEGNYCQDTFLKSDCKLDDIVIFQRCAVDSNLDNNEKDKDKVIEKGTDLPQIIENPFISNNDENSRHSNLFSIKEEEHMNEVSRKSQREEKKINVETSELEIGFDFNNSQESPRPTRKEMTDEKYFKDSNGVSSVCGLLAKDRREREEQASMTSNFILPSFPFKKSTLNDVQSLHRIKGSKSLHNRMESREIFKADDETNNRLIITDLIDEELIAKTDKDDNYKHNSKPSGEIIIKDYKEVDEYDQVIGEEISKILQSSRQPLKDFQRWEYKMISAFEKNEVNFNETVKEFSVMFKEKNYLFIRRRLAVLSDEYFSSHLLKENNIIDHNKRLYKNYQQILETNISKFEQETNFNSIFQDIIGLDSSRCDILNIFPNDFPVDREKESIMLVGKLRDIRYYSEKFHINKTHHFKVLEQSVKDFAYWREISCDGDSFYRAFMFALIEHFIFTRNLHEIKKLFLDIYRINDISAGHAMLISKGVDFSKILSIFYLIINNVQNENYEKAYDVLIKAYQLEDKMFDNAMIGYMRFIMWANINDLDRQIAKNKLAYPNKNVIRRSFSELPEYDEVNINTILVYQNEPTKICLSAIPLIFQVNLEIFSLDGSVNNASLSTKLSYHRIKFTDNSISSGHIPTISLGYFLSSYTRVYPRLALEHGYLSLLQPEINSIQDYSPSIFLPMEEAYCEQCASTTSLAFLTRYFYSVCLQCLKKFIQEVIESRAVIYSRENFINRECKGYLYINLSVYLIDYSRFIELKENVMISDYDILQAFGTNISNLILHAIRKLCFSCDKIFNDAVKIYSLDCNCQFCKECLMKILNSATNGYLYLNNFEKSNLPTIIFNLECVVKSICSCNLPFNAENAYDVLKFEDTEIKAQANARLDRESCKYCMRCMNSVISDGEEIYVDNNRNLVYHKIKVELAANDNADGRMSKARGKVDHVICEPCFEKVIKQEWIDNTKLVKSIPSKAKIIFCNICDNEHSVSRTEWNLLFKKTCCSGCMIL